MDKLKNSLRSLLPEKVEWQIYFYTKTKRKDNQSPYTTYSWSAPNHKLIPSLVESIVNCSVDALDKEDYTLQSYTPNNNKKTIDKTTIDSLLISKNYTDLLEALSQANPYSNDVKKPKGYILVGQNAEDTARYMFIGVGSPVKTYKHAFFNQAVMKETKSDLITIKPYWDVFINNADCYMNGVHAHALFDLQSYHVHNMGDVHDAIKKSGLADNIPISYPKTGKSIFTDIANANKDIRASIQRLINCAEKYPDDEYYGKLKLVNGKLDLSDIECYLSLMDLLACRYTNEGTVRGEIRPINASFLTQ